MHYLFQNKFLLLQMVLEGGLTLVLIQDSTQKGSSKLWSSFFKKIKQSTFRIQNNS